MFSVNEMREVNECGDWYKYHGVQPFDVFRYLKGKRWNIFHNELG